MPEAQLPAVEWDAPRTARPRSVLILIFIATVMMGLSSTMLNIALPHIVRDLNATASQANWMLLSYLLISAPAIVLMGQVADSGEQRSVFLVGIAVFTITSVLLGAAPNPLSFSLLRGVQAVGGAMILSTAAAMIAAIWPPSMLSRPMGVYLAGFAIAQVAGPVAGGIITTVLGWRVMFWIVVPIGLVAAAWGWQLRQELPASTSSRGLRVDVAGNAVLFIALGSMLLAFSRAQQSGWLDSGFLGLGLASFIFILVFLAVETKASYPAISWVLLRNRGFTLGNIAAFMMVVPRLVLPVMMGLYFQGIVGDAALAAALRIMPIAATVAVGSLLAHRLGRGRDDRSLAVEQSWLGTAGLLLLTGALARQWPDWTQLLAMMLVGFSTGVFSTLNASILLRVVPADRAGNVNAVRAMLQTAGMPFGTGLTLSLIIGGVSAGQGQAFLAAHAHQLTGSSLTVLRHGFVLALVAMTAMSLCAVLAGHLLARLPLPVAQQATTDEKTCRDNVPFHGTGISPAWSDHSSFDRSTESQGVAHATESDR